MAAFFRNCTWRPIPLETINDEQRLFCLNISVEIKNTGDQFKAMKLEKSMLILVIGGAVTIFMAALNTLLSQQHAAVAALRCQRTSPICPVDN